MDKPIQEYERERVFKDVFGSSDYGNELSIRDQNGLYRFAQIIWNYLKLQQINN